MEFCDVALSVVGRAYGTLPFRLAEDACALWLVREFYRLRREQFEAFIGSVQAAEVGTTRALAAAFGAKVDPLPDFEDLEGVTAEEEPEWFEQYRKANKLRTVTAD